MWSDYILETTENKALKGTGGIIGLTLRESALARWFLARPVTARYSTNFHENMCGEQNEKLSSVSHHSNSKANIKRWNSDFKKMTDMFVETYLDPFSIEDPPSQLVNFASGVITNSDI